MCLARDVTTPNSSPAFAPSCLLACSRMTSACQGRGRQSASTPRGFRHWVVSFSAALAISEGAQMGNQQPVPLHRLPGPPGCLTDGIKPWRAKTCLASQLWLGERGEAPQHITQPRWHNSATDDGHGGAASQGPLRDTCQLFQWMERQVFTLLFPKDRYDWIGVLLSRAGDRSCAAPGMDGYRQPVVLGSRREA